MKTKHLFKWLCVLMCAMLLIACFAGCSDPGEGGGGEDDGGNNGGITNVGPEAGEYYCDVDEGEILLTISEGNAFALKNPTSEKSGVFTVSGNTLTLDFAEDGDGTATATFSEGTIVLTYDSSVLTFIPKVNFNVTFETNDGTAVDAQSIVNGRFAIKPADPTKEGYAFIGWYSDAELKTVYDFAKNPIKANVTLYAKWVEIPVGTVEHTVSFDLGYAGAPEMADKNTIGGKLYNIETPVRSGYTFAGWCISMYDDAEKLTYAYTEDTVFDADTTLYATWIDNASTKLPAPNVSVTVSGVKWNSVPGANAYHIKIYSSTEIFLETDIGTTSQAYDFSAPKASDYIVEVTALASSSANNSDPTYRYFKGNMLKKVTGFTAVDNVLVFGTVENAEKYYVTIDCGNDDHEHTMVDIGTANIYNFTDCAMQPGGIIFIVTASAEGYENSVSDPFVYDYTDEALLVFTELDNGTYGVSASISANSADVTYIRIPALYEGKLVTKILDSGFKNLSNLEAVSIPDTVTSIGVEAFTGCSGLTDYIVYKGSTELTYESVYSSYDGALMYRTPGGELFLEAFPKAKTGEYTIAPGVTSILSYVFEGARISKVIVSKDVITVPENAFAGCPSLTEIEFEGGRTEDVAISSLAFGESSNGFIKSLKLPARITPFEDVSCIGRLIALETLEVEEGSAVYTSVNNLLCNADPALTILLCAPKKVFSNLAVDKVFTVPGGINGIGKEVFKENTSVLNYTIVIPGYVNVIEDSAFEGSYFGKVVFEGDRFDSLKIGKYAFSGSMISSVEFMKSTAASNVTVTIDSYAFYNCWVLKTVTIGANVNVASVGDYAFSGNSSLTAFTADDNATLTSIGAHAFESCTKLTALVVHASTKSIGDYAYARCAKLASLSVADGSTSLTIGDYAFSGCTALKTVNLPTSVSAFNGSVFDGCTIESMNIASGSAFNTDENGIVYNGDYTEIVYCPKTFGDLSKLRWDTLTKISPCVFKDNKSITSVVFGANITEIGESAFENSSITAISFDAANKNAVQICDNAFNNCITLTSVSLPDTATYIGDYAFASTKLTEITLPSALTYIGDLAFSSVQIATVTIPVGVTYIGDKAFYLTALTSVIVPDGSKLVTIGNYAFAHTSISAFNMPSTVEYIGESAFAGTGLTIVTIPATVTVIGANAFSATPLTTVTFDNGTAGSSLHIYEGAFAGTKLTSVALPSQLKTLGGFDDTYLYHTVESVFSNTLEKLTVADGCTAFKAIQDVLYVIDGDNLILVYCPRAKTGAVTVPTNVVLVEAKAFNGVQISSVTFEEYDTKDERYGKPTLTVGSFTNIVGGSTQSYATFGFAPNLTYIHFPSHLATMNSYAITRMLPEGTYTPILTIDFNVDCEDGVSFESRSMYNISCMKSLTLPKINHIGSYAFYSLGRNLESITFTPGSTFTEIPDSAFASNGSVPFTSFTIPAGVKTIGNSAFLGCSCLEEIIFLGDEVDQIGEKAFSGTGLRSFKIPSSVTAIGAGVFSSCQSLETIEFSKNIETIELQSSLTGSPLHRGCKSLVAFIVPEENQYFSSVNGMLLSKDGTILYACPASSTEPIPSTVTTIESGAFSGYNGTTLILPTTITTVHPWAFQYSAIEHFEWKPATGVQLVDGTFTGLDHLNTFILGDKVTWTNEKQIPAAFRATTAEKNGIAALVNQYTDLNATTLENALVRFKGYGYLSNITTAELSQDEIDFINNVLGSKADKYSQIFQNKLIAVKQAAVDELLAQQLSAKEIAGIDKLVSEYPDLSGKGSDIKQAYIQFKDSGYLKNVTSAEVTKEEAEFITNFLNELFMKDQKVIDTYTAIFTEKLIALKQSIIDASSTTEKVELTAEEIVGLETLATTEYFKGKLDVLEETFLAFKTAYLVHLTSADVTKEEIDFIDKFLMETLGDEMYKKDSGKTLEDFTNRLAKYKQALVNAWIAETLTKEELTGIDKIVSEYSKELGISTETFQIALAQFKDAGYLTGSANATVTAEELEFISAFVNANVKDEGVAKSWIERFQKELAEYKKTLLNTWISETLTKEELAGIDKLVSEYSKELGISAETFQIALAQFKDAGYLTGSANATVTAEELEFISAFVNANVKDEGVAKSWIERFQKELAEYKKTLLNTWISETLTKDELAGIDKLVSEYSKELNLPAETFQIALAEFKDAGFLNAPYSKELSAEEKSFIKEFVRTNVKADYQETYIQLFEQKLIEYKAILSKA